MNSQPPVTLPLSPMSDADFKVLKDTLVKIPIMRDWLDRAKKAGLATPDEINAQYAALDDLEQRTKKAVGAFQDLHPNV